MLWIWQLYVAVFHFGRRSPYLTGGSSSLSGLHLWFGLGIVPKAQLRICVLSTSSDDVIQYIVRNISALTSMDSILCKGPRSVWTLLNLFL